MSEKIQETIKRLPNPSSQKPSLSAGGEFLSAKGSAPRPAPKVECPGCQDAQFVRYDVSLGHPKFGKLFPCPDCNQVGVSAFAGLTPDERNIRMEDLDATDLPSSQAMLEGCQKFAKSPKGFLSLYGGNGNGKTLMLMGIVNVCLERNIEARYMTAHQLMDYLYAAFDKNVPETDLGRIADLARIPVLVIDEFDKTRETPYAFDMQHHLIDQRYRNKGTLGTVFAWNGDMKTIPWSAVRDRMSEFPCLENLDPSQRPIIGKARA